VTSGSPLPTEYGTPGADPATVDALRSELVTELGETAVSSAPERLDGYTADTYWLALHASAAGTPLGRPDLVVTPRDEHGVATALRLADARRVPVVAWGGGSGTQGGSVPTHGGVVLDLTALDHIVEIDERSLTVTCEPGVNGRRLEEELNRRGLMFPHYPASSEWATVGGYVAARGSGVLSTRYGKIEDLVLSLRVVLAGGQVIETVEVPRHAVGPELTQLFVGSEGTLGVITRATLQVVPLPATRTFATVRFPTIGAGVESIRRALAAGARPSVVRMYDDEATRLALSPVVRQELDGVCTVLAFEGGDPAIVEAEQNATLAIAREAGAEELDPELGRIWWDRRYDFYYPPHQPELPSVWGTIDVVATYSRIEAVYDALRAAVKEPFAEADLQLRMHFSHWYPWGTMIYARFVVPDGGGGTGAVALHDRIWEEGLEAAFQAGGVMNDHHGVGLKLAPYMERQHGAALDTLRKLKTALDPNGIMNPGKLGF
jgi:alkyldihydroxyacetonephosphate synthase